MRKAFTILLLWLTVVFAGNMFSQTLHYVSVISNSFVPANLTITVGDTVRWVNEVGLHNVVADDNSFTSGAPSALPWVFDYVFTAVSVNPYYCEVHGAAGGIGMSGVITVENATSVFDDKITVADFELKQNYPNPFNPSTKISFVIPSNSQVQLKVFNILGNEVSTLLNDQLSAGEYTIPFIASGLSSGIYFYSLSVNGFNKTKEMVLLK